MELITSTSNPVVKQARALRQGKSRVKTGLFLVEGIHPVGEVMEAGWRVETILYAPNLLASTFANELLERAGRLQLRALPVSVSVMESLTEKENPQGILAIVQQKRTALEDLRSFQQGVALVSAQDPGNVGAILRTTDAVGADVLFLVDGGVDPFHPTAVRASMGALFWKPIIETSFQTLIEFARRDGLQLVGASAHAKTDFRSTTPRVPWILVLGSEQKGLSPEYIAACDISISLPMRGRASSLNLAVAAGVLLYQMIQ